MHGTQHRPVPIGTHRHPVADFVASVPRRFSALTADPGAAIVDGTSLGFAPTPFLASGSISSCIDGDKLVELFESLELGLKLRTTYDVDVSFFDEYRK